MAGWNNGTFATSSSSAVAQPRRPWLSWAKPARRAGWRLLLRRLPVLGWLPAYCWRDLPHDAIAGVIVGLTIIPQSLVFASVADVPLQIGLYSSLSGCFVYLLLGTVSEMSIGPSAVLGLLIGRYASSPGGPARAALLCFFSGCIELLFGFLNLGFLIDFISAPVSCGFSSAAALMITATQLRTVLGLGDVRANGFYDGLVRTYEHVHRVNYWDAAIGGGSAVTLLVLRWVNTVEWMDPGPFPTRWQRINRRLVRLLCTVRNALVVVASAALAYGLLNTQSGHRLTLTGPVKEGLPRWTVPSFNLRVRNDTLPFRRLVNDLAAGMFLVPVLSILQHLVVAKVFIGGRSLDANQEIVALGAINLLGSFIGALPTTGNLPRSALNANNGVRSPLGGIFTGAVVLLALQLLTPYFQYIPRASLATIVICAVIFMMKLNLLPHLWRSNKMDLAIMLATIVGCIALGVDYGILVGIGLSLVVLLYNAARPNIHVHVVDRPDPSAMLVVQPDRMLSFPAVEYVRYKVCKVADERKSMPVIFDGSHLCGMDFTIAQCVKELTEEFQKRNQQLIFTNLQHAVIDVIEGLQPTNFIYYPTRSDAETALAARTNHTSSIPPSPASVSAPRPSVVREHRIDLSTMGSDCSHPSEYTAAWWPLNVADVLVSIPRVRLVRDHGEPTDSVVEHRPSTY